MGEKFKAFIKNALGYICATLLTAAYIALSFITIDKTGRTIGEIIANGAVYYFYQILLVSIFLRQGISNGEQSEKVVATNKLHGQKVDAIADKMGLLDVWCRQKNKENYKRARTRILARVGMQYSECFTEEGVAIPYAYNQTKLDKSPQNAAERKKELERIKAYNKAVGLKLTELDAMVLTSNNIPTDDEYSLPDDKNVFILKREGTGALLKILPAILFGLFSFRAVENWTWANFAWTMFQAMTGLAAAIPQMLAAQSYVVDDYRGGIIKKIGYIDMFLADYTENPNAYKETSVSTEFTYKENNDEQNGNESKQRQEESGN